MSAHVVVVGGGIAGLMAAHTLVSADDPGVRVTVVEQAPRLGGRIHTRRHGDYLLEEGPDALFLPGATPAWVRELGLVPRLVPPAVRDAFIHAAGRLEGLPLGLVTMQPAALRQLATSRLLSLRGKIGALRDLLARAGIDRPDESVASFVERHFGSQVAERLFDPLLSATHAASTDELSAHAILAQLWDMERRHGSLLRAAWSKRRPQGGALQGPQPQVAGFASGMEELVRAVAARLAPADIRTGVGATRVRARPPGGYEVHLSRGAPLQADAVIVATAPGPTARILCDVDGQLACDIAAIPASDVTIVHVVFSQADVPHLPGAGVLVASSAGRWLSGITFSSRKFEGRAPSNEVLLRLTFHHLAERQPADLNDTQLVQCALADLADIIGIRARPRMWWVTRLPQALPRYTVGHPERVARIDARLARFARLQLAGAAYTGMGVPSCMLSGTRAARAVLTALG